jgi:hypothetical protein
MRAEGISRLAAAVWKQLLCTDPARCSVSALPC